MGAKRISTKDKKAIIKIKLEDPNLSSTDIEKKTWVKAVNIRRIVWKIPEIVKQSWADGKLQREVDILTDIVSDINSIVKDNIKEIKASQKIYEPRDIKSLAETGELHWKRSQVLQDKPTSNDKQTFDFGKATLKELTGRIDELLK